MEIDYGQIQEQPGTTKAVESWEPPPHKYFGPKDPQTGKVLPEPVYSYKPYPALVYKKDGEKIQAKMIRTEAERKSLGAEWRDSPKDFGVVTAPSFDQTMPDQQTLTLNKK